MHHAVLIENPQFLDNVIMRGEKRIFDNNLEIEQYSSKLYTAATYRPKKTIANAKNE